MLRDPGADEQHSILAFHFKVERAFPTGILDSFA